MKKAQPILKDFPHFFHGGDYNPEQWLQYPDILEQDMALMQEANCNEMTMGIFAWTAIEPKEGEFDFSWLDERMDAVYKNGGRVVLATPSASRPHWLYEKHPDVMFVNDDGIRREYGSRANACLNNPHFIEAVKRVDEAVASRYSKHPALAAWHIHNEFGGLPCYCEHCRAKFTDWLKAKYDNDIAKLNHEWWTPVWSHRYDSFEQIEPPKQLGEWSILGLCLDWKRFISDTVITFLKMEADILRKYSDKQITTNCMGFYRSFDHYKAAEHLDFISQDIYPAWWQGITDENVANQAAIGALSRAMKNKPYFVMESAPGVNACGMKVLMNKSDAVQRFEAMLLVATGSDSICYFQWRKNRGCFEKFHGAVVDHYGKTDNRIFQSVKKTGVILKKLDGVVGTGIKADVAIVRDYDTIWALQGKPEKCTWGDEDFGYDKLLFQNFRALWDQNIAADIISYDADFTNYKLLILPPAYMMTQALADKIKAFVENGGTVVSYYLTGSVNENDLMYLGGAPACGLTDLFGLRADEITNYGMEGCVYDNAVTYQGKTYPVKSYAEMIIPSSAQAVASYGKDYLKDTPAVLKNTYGKGNAYYIAFCPDFEFTEALSAQIFADAGVSGMKEITGEDAVRVICREGDGERYFFVLNTCEQAQKATLTEAFDNVLDGGTLQGEQTLPPLGFLVLKQRG